MIAPYAIHYTNKGNEVKVSVIKHKDYNHVVAITAINTGFLVHLPKPKGSKLIKSNQVTKLIFDEENL